MKIEPIVSLAWITVLLLANRAASVSYFGFYSANLSANAAYSNLYQADTLADAAAATAAGVPHSLLLVYDVFFVGAPGALVLRPDYTAQWAILAAQAAPFLTNGTLLGFNVGDELVWNCLAPVNLTIVVNLMRKTFPVGSAIIWYNEATPPLNQDIDSCGHTNLNFSIPVALDWFSTDIYHMDGAVNGWVDTWVRSFYEQYIYPRLTPAQLVMLVPGSFGSNVNRFANGTSICDQQCYDVMCAHDSADFYAWAQSDTRVVAIMPWNWAGCPDCAGCCKDELGTDVQPLATAAWAAIGAALKGF